MKSNELEVLCLEEWVHESWKEEKKRDEKKEIIAEINTRLLPLCKKWLLTIDADWLTNERVAQLNSLVDILPKWIPENYKECTDPSVIPKLFDIAAHISSLQNEVSLKYPKKKRQVLNTINLFHFECPINSTTFSETIEENLIEDSPLELAHLIDIRLVNPSHTLDNLSASRVEDTLFINGDVNIDTAFTNHTLTEHPLSRRVLNSKDEIRPATRKDFNMGLANHLLNLRRLLADPKKLQEINIDECLNFSLTQSYNQKQWSLFEQQLENYKNKYLKENNNGDLTTQLFVTNSKLEIFTKLAGAYHFYKEKDDLDLFASYLKRNATFLGLNDYIKTDIAKFCNTWLQKRFSVKLASTPNPRNVKREKQREGYSLTEKEIDNGLTYLASQYQQKQGENPLLPKLGFLPATPIHMLNDTLARIPRDNGPKSYIGSYTTGARGNHYGFYFLHVWPSGKTTILLLDPAFTDNYEPIEAVFKKAFQKSDITSLQVIQQFNSSDCGICFLQTAKDVIDGLTNPAQEQVFLRFQDDKIEVDPMALTVNAEKPQALEAMLNTRRDWETQFKAMNTCSSFNLEFDKEPSYEIMTTDENYQFNNDKREFDASQVVVEFRKSNAYKWLSKAFRNSVVSKAEYERLIDEAINKFKPKSKEWPIYIREQAEDQDQAELKKYLQDYVFAHLLPNILKPKLATAFLDSEKAQIFPGETYVDDGKYDEFEKLVTETAYKDFLGRHPNYKEVLQLLPKGSQNDIVPSLLEKVNKHAPSLYNKADSLTAFADKTLTYSMLQQCIKIWESSNKSKAHPFINKLKKIVENRNDEDDPEIALELSDKLSRQALSAVKELVNRYHLDNPLFVGHPMLKAIGNALLSTTQLKVPQQNAVNLTLDQIDNEIQNSDAYGFMCKDLMRRTILALKKIQQDNGLPDEQNPIKAGFETYLDDRFNSLFMLPGGSCIHLENHSTWERLKASTNYIVNSVMSGYEKARSVGKAVPFVNKFVDAQCIEGRTMGAIEYATLLESPKKFNQLMQEAVDEATNFLTSVGKELTLNNTLKFIARKYTGTKFYRLNQDEELQDLSEAEIKAYLEDELSLTNVTLQESPKKSILSAFNKYSLPRFEKSLAKENLKSPGLNKLTPQGQTLLIEACKREMVGHVKALVKKGVNINLKDKNGDSAWDVACNQNFQGSSLLAALFSGLTSSKQEEKAKQLLQLAYEKDHRIFSRVISYIKDINFLNQPQAHLQGLTYLEHACLKGKKEHVSALLKATSSTGKTLIDNKSAFKWITTTKQVQGKQTQRETISFIRFAISHESKELTEALLSKINYQQREIAQALLATFALNDATFGAFSTVLKFAQPESDESEEGKKGREFVESLLNEIYDDGETLLTQACLKGNSDQVERLIDANVDITCANKKGQTPLGIAFEKGYADIVQLFLKKYKAESVEESIEIAKSLLPQALKNNSDTLCMLVGEIADTEPEFLASFYDEYFKAIITHPSYFTESTLLNWQIIGFLDYLSKHADKLFQVYKRTIGQKAKNWIAQILIILQESPNNERFQMELPGLLATAFDVNFHEHFTVLLEKLDSFDCIGLNKAYPAGHTLLTAAIKEGRIEIAKSLIANPKLNITVPGAKKSPLSWAVSKGNLELTHLLIERMSETATSLTALRDQIKKDDLLYLAYQENNKELFTLLLSVVSDHNIPGLGLPHPVLGKTFLVDNVTKYQGNYSSLLEDKGFNLPHDQAEFSIYHEVRSEISKIQDVKIKKDYELQVKVIEETVDPIKKHTYARDFATNIPSEDYAPLEAAASALVQVLNHKKTARLDPQKRKVTGYSPLHELCMHFDAANEDHHTNLQNLCKSAETRAAGLLQDAVTGKTAVHYALATDKVASISSIFDEMQKYPEFLQCASLKDFDGRLPLHYFCKSGMDADMIRFLHPGPQESLADRAYMRTPLHYASLIRPRDQAAFVEELLSQGLVGDIDSQDIYGKTALHYVVQNRNEQSVKMLVNAQASCSVKDSNGNTAVHLTCISGDVECIKALMKSPQFFETLFIKNDDNQSPIDLLKGYTNTHRHRETQKYLMPFYKMAEHAKNLEKRKGDPISTAKANAINDLLKHLGTLETDAEKRDHLNSLNLDNEDDALFKPRRTYGFFMARSPCKTDTAQEINSLKENLTAIMVM